MRRAIAENLLGPGLTCPLDGPNGIVGSPILFIACAVHHSGPGRSVNVRSLTAHRRACRAQVPQQTPGHGLQVAAGLVPAGALQRQQLLWSGTATAGACCLHPASGGMESLRTHAARGAAPISTSSRVARVASHGRGPACCWDAKSCGPSPRPPGGATLLLAGSPQSRVCPGAQGSPACGAGSRTATLRPRQPRAPSRAGHCRGGAAVPPRRRRRGAPPRE